MAEGAPAYRVGDIVIVADLPDPQGGNPKDRRCVVVAEPGEGRAKYRVIGITTSLPDVLTIDHVPIPWQRPRHPRTGQDEPNAALCTWVVVVDGSRVVRRAGITPPRQLKAIAEALARLAGETGRDPVSP